MRHAHWFLALVVTSLSGLALVADRPDSDTLATASTDGAPTTSRALRAGALTPTTQERPSQPATTAATPLPTSTIASSTVTTAAAPLPPFESRIEPVSAEQLGASWRPGCPVEPEDLRRVAVSIVGFDGQPASGVVDVHADHAVNVIEVFRRIYLAGFPIERMEPIDAYGGDDNASMAANNTSAFNCRPVTGGTSWSQHSYGWAIDVNPIQNPYVKGSTVLPPAGHAHVERSPARGRILAGDAVVQAFASIGWDWGGDWSSLKDYQHFSATGG